MDEVDQATIFRTEKSLLLLQAAGLGSEEFGNKMATNRIANPNFMQPTLLLQEGEPQRVERTVRIFLSSYRTKQTIKAVTGQMVTSRISTSTLDHQYC